MKVYKFGGASVKDAKNIKNISNILQIYGNNNNILIVISAIDKTTNALEEVVKKYFLKKNIDYDLNKIKEKHFNINNDLFPNGHNIYYYINNLFFNIKQFFKENKSTNYNFVYDQIVSFGELISTKIISEYFNLIGIKNIWIDVRKYIITDSSYGEAKINWQKTFKYITILNSKKNILYITQGFIGGSDSNYTTTLGREGSDYTASIFSYCLNAESQTIWKDVPGILNADPRYFTNVSLLNKISYEEAIKLAYYGATVIHPKTLEPLLKKDIPLYIRSFINHEKTGTLVSNFTYLIKPSLPCYIVKNNQILLTFFKKKYYSFFSEQDISNILKYIAKYFLKIGLLHNSVVDLNICINDTYHINDIIKKLSLKYKIQILEKVSLYTVYHYTNNNCLEEFVKNKIIILSKITLETAQYIIKD
ncbi:MAG: aspartate kinase [Candidatus Bostrichicola ureolyticus]|nr:MAG: aspartate kinase [Candidatus Bostrichicola ureolyticus]